LKFTLQGLRYPAASIAETELSSERGGGGSSDGGGGGDVNVDDDCELQAASGSKFEIETGCDDDRRLVCSECSSECGFRT